MTRSQLLFMELDTRSTQEGRQGKVQQTAGNKYTETLHLSRVSGLSSQSYPVYYYY